MGSCGSTSQGPSHTPARVGREEPPGKPSPSGKALAGRQGCSVAWTAAAPARQGREQGVLAESTDLPAPSARPSSASDAIRCRLVIPQNWPHGSRDQGETGMMADQ